MSKFVKILLPINQRGTREACAAAAFSLAERFDASLEVLHPCPAPTDRLPYATELSPLDYFEELIDVATKQVALEKRKAEAWLAKTARAFSKVHPELVTIGDSVAPTVATRAKVADISVLPRIEVKEEAFWASARDAALFHSGRPVLVMPEAWDDPIGETVVIAWKDRVEAVRAVVAAQPFLADAKHVKLVCIMEHGKDETGAAGMADYLSKAGLRVERVELAAEGDAGPALLEAATGRGVLLVMGAYGHWRWREWMFGGATECVLRNTGVPVLMMH